MSKLRKRVGRWRDRKLKWSLGNSFVILHAPTNWESVPVLLIGRNPGPTKCESTARNDEKDYPSTNFLFESTDVYAITAYAIFAKANRLNHLRFAQSTDMSFFRNVSNNKAAADFCAKSVRDIVRRLKPARIMILGKQAAESYVARCITPKLSVAKIEYGVLAGTRPKIMVCPHFSRRSKVKAEHWTKLVADLPKFLPQRTEEHLKRFLPVPPGAIATSENSSRAGNR